MYVVINRIFPEPGTIDRIVDAFGRASGMQGVPGCLDFEVWRGRHAEELMIVTRWEDEAAYHAWTESEHFKRAHRDRSASQGASSELLAYDVVRARGAREPGDAGGKTGA